jgi:hypothetical protein
MSPHHITLHVSTDMVIIKCVIFRIWDFYGDISSTLKMEATRLSETSVCVCVCVGGGCVWGGCVGGVCVRMRVGACVCLLAKFDWFFNLFCVRAAIWCLLLPTLPISDYRRQYMRHSRVINFYSFYIHVISLTCLGLQSRMLVSLYHRPIAVFIFKIFDSLFIIIGATRGRFPTDRTAHVLREGQAPLVKMWK